MNVRKPVDYGMMHRELTVILAQNLSQMDEIYAIGKAISQRPEKGAAVAAAEFLQANFPDRTGFSPRNVRRMRDFYRTYENDQRLLRLAMKIGWTLNVVIMEAELTSVQRISCLQRAAAERLSKKKLLEIILNDAFAEKPIDEPDEICQRVNKRNDMYVISDYYKASRDVIAFVAGYYEKLFSAELLDQKISIQKWDTGYPMAVPKRLNSYMLNMDVDYFGRL